MNTTRTSERGSALLMSFLATIVVAGLIISGTIVILNSQAATNLQLRTHGQAVSIAQAGLMEALSWFRRHPLDTTFNPQQDLTASPKVNDTSDPSVGIVREFEISEGVYGRYEVRKFGQYKVEDISYSRCYADVSVGDGSAWLLYAVGYIYRLQPVFEVDGSGKHRKTSHQWIHYSVWGSHDHDAFPDDQEYLPTMFYSLKPASEGETTLDGQYAYAHDKYVVEILSRAVVAAEIRRFSTNPPGNAAICCSRGSQVTIAAKGRVLGGANIGILYPVLTGTPTTSAGEVSGTPAKQAFDNRDPLNPADDGDDDDDGLWDEFEVDFVFPKMHKSDLKAMADIYTDDYTTLPSPLPNYSLVYVDGDATFTSENRLVGTGILFVDGNLTISPSCNPSYRGLIYVTGSYTQRAPSLISGTIIVCGPSASVSVSGAGDYSEVDYDSDILDRIGDNMSNYRFSRSMYVVE